MVKLRKAAYIALMCVVVPLFVVLAILGLPLVIAFQLWDFARLRWHCYRTHVWTYLICSPRRGWNEFLVNNVVPILPVGLGCIWATRDRTPRRRPEDLLVWAGTGRAKPYLAEVRPLGIRIRPLNERLRSLKSHAKIDAAFQRDVLAVIEDEVRQLRAAKAV